MALDAALGVAALCSEPGVLGAAIDSVCAGLDRAPTQRRAPLDQSWGAGLSAQ